jgi:hypothetical protein
MPENKGHTGVGAEPATPSATGEARADGALGLRDVLAISGGAVDPCNVTSNLQFRYDSASGNTLLEVQSPDDPRMVTQQIVLPGVDLTAHGSLSDTQVMQLLLSQGRQSTEV